MANYNRSHTHITPSILYLVIAVLSVRLARSKKSIAIFFGSQLTTDRSIELFSAAIYGADTHFFRCYCTLYDVVCTFFEFFDKFLYAGRVFSVIIYGYFIYSARARVCVIIFSYNDILLREK